MTCVVAVSWYSVALTDCLVLMDVAVPEVAACGGRRSMCVFGGYSEVGL